MPNSSPLFALAVDQMQSRSRADEVPRALDLLGALEMELPFERTAGDEIQGLTSSPLTVVETVMRLTRAGGWRIGIGVGPVERPLPESTRAARGPAYLAARVAIQTARSSPADLALAWASASGSRTPRLAKKAEEAETMLWFVRMTAARRSDEGWELMDLLESGLTNARAADLLGISPSAVSQRLARSYRPELLRGEALATSLLSSLLDAFEDPDHPVCAPVGAVEREGLPGDPR